MGNPGAASPTGAGSESAALRQRPAHMQRTFAAFITTHETAAYESGRDGETVLDSTHCLPVARKFIHDVGGAI